ncbi:MAG: DUF6076 domain-containing protein [Oscillospiraceae bacterium]|nr:DUF6076 domain-containing protein [Oscillospiraceae bacterium]
MVLECFRSANSDACALTLRDRLGEADIQWNVQLKSPAHMVLAFMNEDCGELLAEEEDLRRVQQLYWRESFGKASLRPLRELVEHVLLCKQEKGFDPIVRLAAYTFAEGLFDVDRLTRYTEKATLETSVRGAAAMESMMGSWSALLEARSAAALPGDRAGLFEALLADAAEKLYPFELSFCQEYSSLTHLLKAFVIEMIRGRVLLKRCLSCGRCFLSAESVEGYCGGPCPAHPEISCREACGAPAAPLVELSDEIARLYKQIYNVKANRAKRSREAVFQKELAEFKEDAQRWRLRLRSGAATQREYHDWLKAKR